MATSRKGLCALVVLALAIAPALSGCGGSAADAPASAQAHSGFIDSFVEKLKREDDEAEVKEIREHEGTREEREEAHEQAEDTHIERVRSEEQEEQ